MARCKLTWIIVFLFSAALLAGCGNNEASPTGQDDQITVYTSFYTMYDFTSKISGGKVKVINMVPSGMEPHDWEPSPKDIAGLSGADLFIYNGLGMEGWAEKVLESVNNPHLVVVEASKGITSEEQAHTETLHDGENEEAEHGHSHGDMEYDPHVWLNPLYAKKQMEAIRDGLIQVDPQNKKVYEDNFRDYSAKLDALDKAYRDAEALFKRHEIIVSHAAFGYLCSAYGLEQIAIDGISGESEPTPAKMAEIIDFAAEHDVKVIFFEEMASPKAAEAIARETGAGTAVLNSLEGLSEENLNEGKDYFSIMEENLEALKQALQ